MVTHQQTNARVQQIGPQTFLVRSPGSAPVTFRRGSASAVATPEDMILSGVLDWYATLGCSEAQLWGEHCTITLATSRTGRWVVIARRPCGERRFLVSRLAIASAEMSYALIEGGGFQW